MKRCRWSFLSFLFTLFLFSLILTSCDSERIHTPRNTGEQNLTTLTENPASHAFDEFCLAVFKDEMHTADTLDLHYTLIQPEIYNIVPSGVSLGTCKLADMISDQKQLSALKAELSEFDRTKLSDHQKVTYDALKETLNTSLMASGLELYQQPLAPTIGVQAQLPILLAEYSFHSAEDAEAYLSLLSQTDCYYKEILDFEIQKAEAGLGASDATIDNIIKSCESYLIDPENNFLTETFSDRLKSLPLSENQKSELSARHVTAIREHFVPAYQALIDGMSALKGRGLNDGGLSGFADGKRYYEYLLKSGPGLSYSVSELKNALNNRMQEDYEAIIKLFAAHPELEEAIKNSSFSLSDPEQILKDLQNKLVHDFPPLKDVSYEIRYVPEYLQDTLSPAFYLTAPLDDTAHNIIYINNGYSDSTDSLYTTLAHEGFPGHLYQTVYNRKHLTTPLQAILSCSGANEGWATYAENYACTWDNGLADGVGEYRARIRSFSLCVHGLLDIGINYDGWSREQAREYILNYFQVDDRTADELWQVMIDNPTNYLDYCGGYVEIMEMRKEAENFLGSRFSPLEFHRFLLDIGPVPFSVIRDHFRVWLYQQKDHFVGEVTPKSQTFGGGSRKWSFLLCMIGFLKHRSRFAEI